MQDRLILLVGPSGSGKTTIAKELEKLGYNIIHSYTNREPREPNEWGHTFISAGNWYEEGIYSGWINDNEEETSIHENEMIAYFSEYDMNKVYFATYEQYQGKGTSIYIVDPDGANQVKDNVKDAEVVTIFLMADKGSRYWRLLQHRLLSDASDRLTKDDEIFKTCKCNYVVDANRELGEVVKDVIEIIEGEI